jgi:hypothetical protein
VHQQDHASQDADQDAGDDQDGYHGVQVGDDERAYPYGCQESERRASARSGVVLGELAATSRHD